MDKTPSDSAVEMRELVMPNHANPHGTIFGGQVMYWIDMAAAMAAAKHCGDHVVTLFVNSLKFEAPVKIGHHILIKACVNYVKNTSLEVGVRVESEDPRTGQRVKTTKAYLTFVCLGDDGRPKKAPGLTPQTAQEKRRFQNAQKKYTS